MDVNEELKFVCFFVVFFCRGGGLGWGQGRCEQGSEVFVKINKKKCGGGGGRVGGVRVDVNEELKFL